MLEELKKAVCEANLLLPAMGLVKFTWGNVSGIDRERGIMAIKPSGVAYSALRPADIVLVNMDGEVVEGDLRPSSDTATHLELYKAFPSIGGAVHTHSVWATAWAQAGRGIPCYGTTHADDFYGEIPCTRSLTPEEIREAYEKNTGAVIAETFRGLDPVSIAAVLVRSHGPFAWGPDPVSAVNKIAVLELVAEMAAHTEALRPGAEPAPKALQDEHYFRKHGPNARYGQS